MMRKKMEIITVPFIAKMKTIKKKLKYFAPKESVNIKINQPTIVTGMGYIMNQYLWLHLSEKIECAKE